MMTETMRKPCSIKTMTKCDRLKMDLEKLSGSQENMKPWEDSNQTMKILMKMRELMRRAEMKKKKVLIKTMMMKRVIIIFEQKSDILTITLDDKI